MGKSSEQTPYHRRYMANKHLKAYVCAQHHMSSGKFKLKQQRDITAGLTGMAQIQIIDSIRWCWRCWGCRWGCGAAGTLIHCWWACKMVRPLRRTISYKISMLSPFNQQSCSFGVYSDELKTYAHTKTCTQVFTAFLFITAKTQKQPRCPSVGEKITELWSIGQWTVVLLMDCYLQWWLGIIPCRTFF